MNRKQTPPSNQLALEGLGLEGEEMMKEVRTWKIKYGRIHGDGSWDRMVELAKRQAAGGRVSAKYLVEVVRAEYKRKIGKFEVKSSKCDSWTDIRL